MLARRLLLLAEVERLARSLGVPEDAGAGYTCETAGGWFALCSLSVCVFMMRGTSAADPQIQLTSPNRPTPTDTNRHQPTQYQPTDTNRPPRLLLAAPRPLPLGEVHRRR
jgi:hypothetical protein